MSFIGTNFAPFQRILAEGGGGQSVRGGTAYSVSPWNGKQELNRTAGWAVRAVASSHCSRNPSRAIAPDTAE
jgi:hypothetical protein